MSCAMRPSRRCGVSRFVPLSRRLCRVDVIDDILVSLCGSAQSGLDRAQAPFCLLPECAFEFRWSADQGEIGLH